ncbi:MAG: hypothetical protein Q9161_001719 [Pseudevernia consocians]
MDHFKGITAEISSNGQVMNLYDDPDAAENTESHARHYYVEAVACSTFQVKVNLTPQFNFYKMKPAHAVLIGIKIDGNSDSSRIIEHTKRSLQNKFSQGELGGHTFKGPRHFCSEAGKWVRSEYSFGNLVLKETPGSGLSVGEAHELGKIQVTVRRVKKEKRRVAKVRNMKPISTINEIPEKALKGRPIETTVSPSPAVDISDDEADQPVVKPESDSLTTDSSNDQSNTPLTRSAGSSDERRRQIAALEALITNLKRADVEAEAANTGTGIKNERFGVKRERDEEGNQGSRQRRRTSKIEHVDLTDD